MKRINSGATAGVTEITFLRKPQYQFGWDWGPEIPVSGIYGSVYIDTDEVRITDMKVDTVFDNSAVTLHVSAEFTGAADGYILSVTAPDGTVVDKRGIAGSDNKVDRDFLIDDPMIWETADISGGKKQPLYTVKLCLTKGKDNYVATKRIGIRKLRLIRDKLPDGSDFCFELNGRRIFAKGANWIPADAMPDRIDEEVFRYHLQAAVNAGFNMVRVWGGGFYEHDKFYDICDELGLLVWQDCAVACRPCPFYDEKYLKNMLSEIDFNVKRLRHHPSLALWCGNNELEDMSINWITSRKYIDCTYDFFYRILPGEKVVCTIDIFAAGDPNISIVHTTFSIGSCRANWNAWAQGLRTFPARLSAPTTKKASKPITSATLICGRSGTDYRTSNITVRARRAFAASSALKASPTSVPSAIMPGKMKTICSPTS